VIDLEYRKHLWGQGYWEIPEGIDTSNFDFTWRPDPYDRPYIHQFGTQHQKTGGPRFIILEDEGIKYQSHQHAVKLPNPDDRGWRPLVPNSTMDFSWHPDDTEPPFIYVFGNQWYDVDTIPTYQYRVKGATEKKYMYDVTATLLPIEGDRKYRPLKPNISFDYSWQPHPHEPPFIYVFGNQWYDGVTMPTLEYRMPGATQKKYVDDMKAVLLPDTSKWTIPNDIENDFDYSWEPHPIEPPFIWQFGTQWQKNGGPRYNANDATVLKHSDLFKATKKNNKENRAYRPLVSNIEFDYSWHPDEDEPPMIYVFGNQWYDSVTMPTLLYRVKGATEKKYMTDIKVILTPNKSMWTIPEDIENDFDYSWLPHPDEPPFIWQFGTQWQKNGGPRYNAPNATVLKHSDLFKAIKLPNMRKWRIPEEIETDKFDFSWHPDNTEPPMMYEFGTQWQPAGGPIYVTTGSTQKKYCSDQIAIRVAKENRCYRPIISNLHFDYSWHPDPNEPPYIYVFGNQWYDAEVMPTLLYRVKDATEKKYITNVKAKLTEKMDNWVTPDDVDFTVFDYSWCPHPGEPPLIHQFGTQWQRSGGPAYIAPNANGKKYEDIIKAVKKPNIRNWRIIESIDKETFDFSWHPDETEENYNHIFGTKFRTPEVLPALMYRGNATARNNKYNNDLQADLQIPKIIYEDSIFDACMESKFSTTYAHFIKGVESGNYNHDLIKNANTSIHLFPSEAIIPREAIQHMYDKLTDYDYVVEHKVDETVEPLDVIFFSNGEACAESNYEHLLSLNLPNRIVRVDGVQGRVASQHAAANASNTPWYFLVNAKLKVRENFDFNWQPNIYKSRRHYIFTATNPVNGLEYGHQAIVANNKKLTLNTVVRGLDYTMDSPTEVVNVNSGISMYNSSPYDTWRTAFREMIKLCCNTDQESIDRGAAWLNTGNGDFGEYSKLGAKDAIDYYNSVDGDMDKLMLSYDWEWLHEFYMKYYG